MTSVSRLGQKVKYNVEMIFKWPALIQLNNNNGEQKTQNIQTTPARTPPVSYYLAGSISTVADAAPFSDSHSYGFYHFTTNDTIF